MPKRPLWSGSISFGLVNIPIRLYSAVSEQRVAFHQLHDEDKARLRRRFVCPADGKEIHSEHLVRGYEVSEGRYVVVSEEELESCAPERSQAIEITDFVGLDEIDPVYFDHPYYVLPQGQAWKSYRLLNEAMKRSKKVGIARIVIHDKEHLASLRPVGDAILLETMHFDAEVQSPHDVVGEVNGHKLTEKELKPAADVVESMTTKFSPQKYRDEYRQCLMDAIKSMTKKHEVVTDPSAAEADAEDEEAETPAARGKARDLMAALQASLAHAKAQAQAQGHARKRKSA
jgi:DNA end-binding protein Ku